MLEFKNDVLEMKQLDDMKFECNFLGHKTTHVSSADYFQKNWDYIKSKRNKAYDLVPSGCKVMPSSLCPLLDCLFIGGVLEDSVYIVYGLGKDGRGISGYSCSLFFLPTKEVVNSICDYDSLHGEFKIKQ